MTFGDTPQLSATVVVIHQRDLPAVFVDVHVALGVDVPLARLDRADHFPHAVQFVAGQVLVDVAGLDDVVVLEARRIELVAVVGDVHLLLAHQLPVVAVGSAGKHVEVVGGAQAIGRGARPVIGHLRRTAHAALAGVVDPGQARLFHLVEGFVHQQHVARQARRGGDRLLEEAQHVGRLGRVDIRDRLGHRHFFFEADRRVAAVGLRGGLGDDAAQVAAVVTGDVVPQHLHAILRNREGVVTVAGEVFQAVAVVDRLDVERAALDRFVDVRRQVDRAVARVHRDLVGLGVALEHRHLAVGEFVLVLVDGGGGDHEQRFFTGKRVSQEAFAVHRAGVFRDAAGPGRDRAVDIAGFFGADWREGGAQLGRFFRRHGCHHVGGQQTQGQHCNCLTHRFLSFFKPNQKFTPKLRARKSRSVRVL
ncbi:hypothetical protein PS687_05636 [Pseudomonas fluorescens]|nr:hypothetical protein PS687_05636 [Pseudomonas fluorescens]